MYYYIYVLYSKLDNRFYVGYTKNLKERIKRHLTSENHTTSRFKSIELVYSEACKNGKDARVREKQLKTGFGRGYIKKRIKNYLDSNSIRSAAIV
ncbi:GIY-YIG nuclease family protein [Elusimicrobiota bacterium]